MTDDHRINIADWQADQASLLAVRLEVFVEEQGVPLELEVDQHDPLATHLLALDTEDRPIGSARLLANGQIGRMAVRRQHRHQGVGRALLRAALQLARQQGLPAVFLHAQCSAEAFYAAQGFVAEGEIFDDAGIPHRLMRRALDDQPA